MAKKNPKIDSYVSKANPFAKPILKKLRATVHKACPQVAEDIKWGSPFYLYQNRVLCATMAFKNHCALVFWKAGLMGKKSATVKAELKRLRKITDVSELPPQKELTALLKLAMHFNEPTTKLPPREKRSAPVKVPKDFALALKANPKAAKNFEAFSPSKRKDYIFWIASAKTDETRERRTEQSIDWISEGKSRNWKYEESQKKKR